MSSITTDVLTFAPTYSVKFNSNVYTRWTVVGGICTIVHVPIKYVGAQFYLRKISYFQTFTYSALAKSQSNSE